MLIKNITSGKESTVDEAQWQTILDKGWKSKFEIIEESDETPELTIPEESKPASFQQLVKAAKECDDRADLEGALKFYEKAFDLRVTNKLAKRIDEIKKALENTPEEEVEN